MSASTPEPTVEGAETSAPPPGPGAPRLRGSAAQMLEVFAPEGLSREPWILHDPLEEVARLRPAGSDAGVPDAVVPDAARPDAGAPGTTPAPSSPAARPSEETISARGGDS